MTDDPKENTPDAGATATETPAPEAPAPEAAANGEGGAEEAPQPKIRASKVGKWRALSLLLRVCEAMSYAHAKGVIHRDLKPANVMVGSFGEVYVMDWGLARVLGRADAHDVRLAPDAARSSMLHTDRSSERDAAADSPLYTMDGDVVGTPAYMPLEQARGEVEKLTARTDVYAIGAMLYHLLARQMP